MFDPRRTETAKVASEHHFIRPGTDVYVLLAMLHVLFDEGLASSREYVDGLDAVRSAVAGFDPERAERASGVPADEIRRIAREFAAADGAAAYSRMGVSTNTHGTVAQWAVQLLNLVTGNLDREGGTLFTTPAIDSVGRGLVGKGHHDAWRSRVRGLPETAGELPVSALREEIETPGEGQIRALLTLSGNPVLSTPDGSALGRAMEGLDFMAAVDIYVNETTRHADVILPPTTALERDHYDLDLPHPRGAQHGAVHPGRHRQGPQPTARLGDLPRGHPAADEAAAPQAPAEEAARDPGPADDQPDVPGGPAAPHRQAGVTISQLRKNPAGVDLGPLQAGRLPERLFTKSKRVDAAPELVLADLARLDQVEIAPRDGELVLIGRRHQRDNNSWMHNTERLTRGKPRHQLLMHPDDLAARGITDGNRVTVTSGVGSVEVEVRADDDMMPGVVSLPHGYGHQVDGTGMSRAAKVPGVSINDLTDPQRLDVSGNAALNGVPVDVSPA